MTIISNHETKLAIQYENKGWAEAVKDVEG